ncbi:MAG: AmmeMemoRadiSam system radical SAM enzyme [Proteobacteria bacterium]|nr:AmmeMemoRadiSam system radical SAM enzyme [Pseudomonadota bacterium]
MKEAKYFEKLEDKKVSCFLCRHHCIIKEDKKGICGVRKNINGSLYSLVYERVIAKNVDPIEKKPLFHFLPSTKSYSIATVGCNFRCFHCQNYEISQMPREEDTIMGSIIPVEDIVDSAIYYDCKSISYTYTEPTIFYEYAYDVAVLAKQKGLKNVFVTNGYIEKKPLEDIKPYLDGANVDLKGFSEDFYKKVCGASLKGVLESLINYKKLDIWLEITTLIIPTYNDKEEELKGVARFIKAELGEETPWHVTAFYPTYKLTDAPPTPVKTLKMAREIGFSEGLKYVYTGNIPGEEGESTYCPHCRKKIIERVGFRVSKLDIINGSCKFCNREIAGVWS